MELRSDSGACLMAPHNQPNLTIESLLNSFSNYEDDGSLSTLQSFIQKRINTLSGVYKKGEFTIDKNLIKKNETELNGIMTGLFERTNLRAISSQARDAILQLCAKNVDINALDINFSKKMFRENLLTNLLDIAAEIEDRKYESSMRISRNTKLHVSLVLERVFICSYYDKAQDEYIQIVELYIKSLLIAPDIESKMRAILVITCLLNGPIEVGNQCLSKQGIVEMMLAMASSDDELQQKIAAEALIAATAKRDKCTRILSMGKDILKKLYMSNKDEIKVRALVGLCKLSSSGGTDASIKPFDEDVMKKLLTACKKFLTQERTDLDSDTDLKRWSAEGIAFLTLDGNVKEELCRDPQMIRSLIELAKTGDMNVIYGMVTTFVNLTNSYDKQEVLPEMRELAKFAKQHIPEEHVKDRPEFVQKRCEMLVKLNVITALVSLSKTQSKSSREMISRVVNALCEYQHLRGKIVQDGGARILIQLATKNNTKKGEEHARQAIARIAITINPVDAFPGKRCLFQCISKKAF